MNNPATALRLVIGAALALLMSLLAPIPAAQASTTKTQAYSITRSFYSTDLGVCFRVRATGSMRVTLTYLAPHQGPAATKGSSPRLLNPKIELWTLNNCTSTAVRRVVSKASITQRWYHYSCNVHPNIGVGYPWSVSIAPTVNCGDEEVGKRSSSDDDDHSYYYQANSGTPVSWQFAKATTTSYSMCIGGTLTVRVYRNGGNDSKSWKDLKACVKYYGP